MATGERSPEVDACRPCPLLRLGCGSAGEPLGSDGSPGCSPGAAGVAFVLPLVLAALGAWLAEVVAGPQPIEQLLGALGGLTVGVFLAVAGLRLLGPTTGETT